MIKKYKFNIKNHLIQYKVFSEKKRQKLMSNFADETHRAEDFDQEQGNMYHIDTYSVYDSVYESMENLIDELKTWQTSNLHTI
jgi:hypothetical protein